MENDYIYQSKKGLSFEIKPATEDDCEAILGMINELALFEKMPNEVEMTVDRLKRDLKNKAFFCFLAWTKDESDNIVPAGMNIFFLGYSTWKGQFIHMEDLYIRPQYRRNGLGEFLIKYLSRYAISQGIKRIEWSVLEWNKDAISLYDKIGGIDMHATEQWITYRLTDDKLKSLGSY
uniref:N-acetyltransferase domain-containing protein n=1 Tax=Parastrongyloides trichosuri TaxID=131310 RepID=A0A0N4Z5M3_PARTI